MKTLSDKEKRRIGFLIEDKDMFGLTNSEEIELSCLKERSSKK